MAWFRSINTGFTALRHNVPNATQNDSKAVILRKAAQHITYLEQLLYKAGIAFSAGTRPPTPAPDEDEVEERGKKYGRDRNERMNGWAKSMSRSRSRSRSRSDSEEKGVDVVMREVGEDEEGEEEIDSGREVRIRGRMDDAEEDGNPRGWDGLRIGGLSTSIRDGRKRS
jgi:hypothetical protein